MIPYAPEAYDLLHQGTIALAKVEAAGIRVDVDYLERSVRRTRGQIERMTEELETTETMKVWRKAYGGKTKIASGDQLGDVLFNRMGLVCPKKTTTGKNSTDEDVLEQIDDPFVKMLLKIRKLQKALTTNLRGLLRETVDGYIHPMFDLNTAATYRSSSQSPNFQNLPIRDPEQGRLIRSAFIPRAPDRQIVEVDYKALEVNIAACYHKDPKMLDYITDPSKDMHRDMAMECFLLPAEQVTKDIRFWGKSGFVFPQFYGDYYIDCAQSMWSEMNKASLKLKNGTLLREHLLSKGIRELGDLDPREDPRPGTFEGHIKQVEKRFWGDRFPVYAKWRKDWYTKYQEQGWFLTLTGFICQGFMRRNEVINYGVQGSAFHCLLWSLIRIAQREIQKRKMGALIVGQIHDSLVGDVPSSEVPEFVAMCQDVMTRILLRRWRWIIIPLTVEFEIAPPGRPWSEKAPYKVAS